MRSFLQGLEIRKRICLVYVDKAYRSFKRIPPHKRSRKRLRLMLNNNNNNACIVLSFKDSLVSLYSTYKALVRPLGNTHRTSRLLEPSRSSPRRPHSNPSSKDNLSNKLDKDSSPCKASQQQPRFNLNKLCRVYRISKLCKDSRMSLESKSCNNIPAMDPKYPTSRSQDPQEATSSPSIKVNPSRITPGMRPVKAAAVCSVIATNEEVASITQGRIGAIAVEVISEVGCATVQGEMRRVRWVVTAQ